MIASVFRPCAASSAMRARMVYSCGVLPARNRCSSPARSSADDVTTGAFLLMTTSYRKKAYINKYILHCSRRAACTAPARCREEISKSSGATIVPPGPTAPSAYSGCSGSLILVTTTARSSALGRCTPQRRPGSHLSGRRRRSAAGQRCRTGYPRAGRPDRGPPPSDLRMVAR